MNKEMEWNTEVTKIHHTNYVRNSRAIAVAWFVFCACYTILNVVVFIQPFWFGDTNESPGVGYFGVYEWCERVQGSDYRCQGNFLDFTTITNEYFRATSFLVGMACLLFIFSIICMLMFLFLKPAVVLRICGSLQLIAAVLMAVGCIIYPNSFDDDDVRRVCGQEAQAYNMDKCQIRWGYILAIVLIFDALILSVLAFVLAARQAKEIPEMEETKEANSYNNKGFAGEFVNVVPSTRVKSAYRPRNPQPVEPSSLPGYQPVQNASLQRSQLSSFAPRTNLTNLTLPPEMPANKPDIGDSPPDTDPSSSISIPSPRSNIEEDEFVPQSNVEEDEFMVVARLEGSAASSRSNTPVRSRSNLSKSSQSSISKKSNTSDIRF